MDSRRKSQLAALIAGSLACLPLWLLRNFTVDDALITARVAHHLATGGGHRFNVAGPGVDAVTPLGFAWLLVPWSAAGPLAGLAAAKWIGAAGVVASAALCGAQIARAGVHALRYAPLLILGCSAPLGAWGASGLETGVVTLLATLALTRASWGALAAGSAAFWRPELAPWAVVLSVGAALARGARMRGVLCAVALSVGPPVSAAVIRALVFGSATPLAALAKPSDLEHGLAYVLAASLGTGVAPLVVAARALGRVDGHVRAIALGLVVHCCALVLAGGDWMVLYRLMVPVIPGALLVSAALSEVSPRWVTVLRVAVGAAPCLTVALTTGVRARHVGEHRTALIAAAREPLRGATNVAGLDVGWLGAVTRARVTDLAGVTDPSIAALPGGHTSKRISRAVLEQRDVDALVLLLAPGEALQEPWWQSRWDRAVEWRAAHFARELGFGVRAVLPLGGTSQSYVVLRRAAQLTYR